MAEPENIEARIKTLEARANVVDVHGDHVARQVGELVVALREMHTDLRDRMEKAATSQATTHQELVDHIESDERLKVAAFVGGDPHKHRLQHESQMQRDIEAGKDWRDIRLHVLKAGAIGALIVIIGLLGLGALNALSARLAAIRIVAP